MRKKSTAHRIQQLGLSKALRKKQKLSKKKHC